MKLRRGAQIACFVRVGAVVKATVLLVLRTVSFLVGEPDVFLLRSRGILARCFPARGS